MAGRFVRGILPALIKVALAAVIGVPFGAAIVRFEEANEYVEINDDGYRRGSHFESKLPTVAAFLEQHREEYLRTGSINRIKVQKPLANKSLKDNRFIWHLTTLAAVREHAATSGAPVFGLPSANFLNVVGAVLTSLTIEGLDGPAIYYRDGATAFGRDKEGRMCVVMDLSTDVDTMSYVGALEAINIEILGFGVPSAGKVRWMCTAKDGSIDGKGSVINAMMRVSQGTDKVRQENKGDAGYRDIQRLNMNAAFWATFSQNRLKKDGTPKPRDERGSMIRLTVPLLEPLLAHYVDQVKTVVPVQDKWTGRPNMNRPPVDPNLPPLPRPKLPCDGTSASC